MKELYLKGQNGVLHVPQARVLILSEVIRIVFRSGRSLFPSGKLVLLRDSSLMLTCSNRGIFGHVSPIVEKVNAILELALNV
jgi:hypothetical protein